MDIRLFYLLVTGYPKPLLIMANFTILFNDLEGKFSLSCKHDVFDGDSCSINIQVEGDTESFITLDISTAIKFAKTLRTEINLAKELEEQMRNKEALKNQTKLF